jgi:hypothetical protein
VMQSQMESLVTLQGRSYQAKHKTTPRRESQLLPQQRISSSGVTQDVTTPEEASKPSLPAFQAQLRGDLQGHEALDGIDGFSTLTERYINLLKESESALKPLDENATPEEREAYNQRLGVPETPEGYELPVHDADKNAATSFAKLAHERRCATRTSQPKPCTSQSWTTP